MRVREMKMDEDRAWTGTPGAERRGVVDSVVWWTVDCVDAFDGLNKQLAGGICKLFKYLFRSFEIQIK
jgi:hypothetical protein